MRNEAADGCESIDKLLHFRKKEQNMAYDICTENNGCETGGSEI